MRGPVTWALRALARVAAAARARTLPESRLRRLAAHQRHRRVGLRPRPEAAGRLPGHRRLAERRPARPRPAAPRPRRRRAVAGAALGQDALLDHALATASDRADTVLDVRQIARWAGCLGGETDRGAGRGRPPRRLPLAAARPRGGVRPRSTPGSTRTARCSPPDAPARARRERADRVSAPPRAPCRRLDPPRHLVARLPAGVRRRRAGALTEEPRRAAPAAAADGLARPPGLAGLQRLAARSGLQPRHPRLRHRSTTSAIDPPARVTSDDFDDAGGGLPRARASGCCSTACSTTSAAASRGSARRSSRGRASPAGEWFDSCTTPSDGVFSRRDFEGHDAAGHAQPRQPRGAATSSPDVMLHWLRPRRRRLAAGRRVRRARARSGRPCCRGCATRIRRRVVRRRDDPRRLRRLRRRVRPRLGHPVRAVEGDLVLAERPQLPRARLDAAPARGAARALRAADVPRQPRRHPGGQPDRPTRGTSRTRSRCWASCPACRASTTATSSGCEASRRSGPAATTRSGPSAGRPGRRAGTRAPRSPSCTAG